MNPSLDPQSNRHDKRKTPRPSHERTDRTREPRKTPFFRFKPEFGWSELFALAAIALSVWAILIARMQSKDSLATVHLGEPEVQVFQVTSDSTKKMETVVYLRVPVENKGGRPTTLMQISAVGRDRWIEPFDGGQYRMDLPIVGDLLVAPETFSMRIHNLSQWGKLRSNGTALPLHPAWDVQNGLGRDLVLLAIFDPDQFPPQARKRGRLRLRFEFSNGESIPLEAAFALMGELPPSAPKTR